MTAVLDGFKVLDLTRGIAGPYATKMLADYGAEVIKVEEPLTGDPARQLGPFLADEPHAEKSGTFLHLNTNKQGITLNLYHESGQELLRGLVQKVDAVIEDLGPGVLASFGLDGDTLEGLNPRLVLTSISNFGPDGPYRDYKATDITAFAMGGWMTSVGDPGREPLSAGQPYASYVTGQQAAIGTLLALFHAEASGEGQRVDISMQEAVISAILYDTVTHSYSGEVRKRRGNGLTAMYGPIFATNDGYIHLHAQRASQRWGALWAALLGEAEKPPTIAEAVAAGETNDLIATLEQLFGSMSKEEYFHTAQMVGITGSYIADAKDIIESPHHAERGYFAEIAHPIAGTLTYSGPPFRFSKSPWALRQPAPTLGQHNAEVYGEYLGLSRDDLAQLKVDGVV